MNQAIYRNIAKFKPAKSPLQIPYHKLSIALITLQPILIIDS